MPQIDIEAGVPITSPRTPLVLAPRVHSWANKSANQPKGPYNGRHHHRLMIGQQEGAETWRYSTVNCICQYYNVNFYSENFKPA